VVTEHNNTGQKIQNFAIVPTLFQREQQAAKCHCVRIIQCNKMHMVKLILNVGDIIDMYVRASC